MFIWLALGFVAGIFGLFLLPSLPDFIAIFFSFEFSSLGFKDFLPFLISGFLWVLTIVLLVKFKLSRLANFVAGLGFSLIVFVVHLSNAAGLPANKYWVNQHADIKIELVGLPEVVQASFGRLVRLEGKIIHLETANNSWELAKKPLVRLNCYRCQNFEPRAGEVWSLPVKLKPIYGMVNPGAFDYEAWAWQKGLRARGYITDIAAAELIESKNTLSSFREKFAKSMAASWDFSNFKGVYAALVYGDTRGISAEDWDVLRVTGTIHLVAISGLHLAIIAGLVFLIAGRLWRIFPGKPPLPRQVFATFFALALAAVYLVLAGFAIPTQRAWLMLGVGVVVLVLFRKPQVWSALLLAAVVILIVEPASILAQGFWLSFLAVALIFITLSFSWVKKLKGWQQLGVVQLVLSLGLMPALWWFHQQLPIYGVLANLVAVPFVSLFALPSLFAYVVLWAISPSFAEVFLRLLDFSWVGIWRYLEFIASLPFASWTLRPIDLWQVLLIYLGLFSGFLIKNSWRYLGFGVFLVALVFPYQVDNPQFGEFDLTLLDVGQGQALVIETQNKVLVYDAGPKLGAKLSGASVGITPFLKFKARKSIDHLMISHADMDHAGGVDDLIKDWQIGQLSTGELERLGRGGFSSCHDLAAWEWDGVRFELLDVMQFEPKKSNDFSCILKVSAVTAGEASLDLGELPVERGALITGDLDFKFERQLVDKYAERLEVDLLVAGHHGSKYSSDAKFLAAVNPTNVLFSSGWLNRFGFPNRDTVLRVEKQGSAWLNTACSGAITFRFTGVGVVLQNEQRKSAKKWFYQDCEF